MNTAILLAAGSGRRMQSAISDKILARLDGTTVFARSISALAASGVMDAFTIVFRDELQREELATALLEADLADAPVNWVQGGNERQHSVFNALRVQPGDCKYVFIHDSARPLVSPKAIQDLRDAVERDDAAALAHRVTDTIKRIPDRDKLDRADLEDLDRSRLWAMETPQAFAYASLLNAYEYVHDHGLTITDDSAAAATIGLRTTIVPNTAPNPKITVPADLRYAEWALLQARERRPTQK